MNKSVSFFLIAAILFSSLTACLKDQAAEPCKYDPCQLKAPAAEIQAVQTYLDTTGVTDAVQHCSGLFYKIVTPGTGVAPDPCINSIVARYRGSLTNGNVFDSGQFQQPVQLGGFIRGWVNGLPLIKQGGRMMLYVPPSLGYGSQARTDQNGVVLIPANSTLVFDVELVTVY